MNRNTIDFSERMAAGRDLAQAHRNLGRPVGRSAKGWNYTRNIGCDADSWEWLCREARRDWRSDCRQIINDFRAACLSGPNNDLHTFGEF